MTGLLAAIAFLTGLGGLLIELSVLRRHGLLLGNTSEASALVLAVFLAALGAGGLLAPKLRLGQQRPLCGAALLYAAVAATSALFHPFLASLPPQPWGAGAVLVLWMPGLPCVLMGAAFPLLFAALREGSGPFLLLACNLLGSVAGAWFGGNLWIPELGLLATSSLGAGAYGVAALLLATAARREPSSSAPPPPGVATDRDLLALAFAAGLLVLGGEVVWLRRLPFFIEGFQPTLSGLLAAVLLALSAGSAFAAPLLLRCCGGRAARVALVLGAAACGLGLHEWLAPAAMRLPVGSDLGMHLRVALVAVLASALPCLFLGAVVPLCLQRYVHKETRPRHAGRLFCAQGLGSLCGALLAGHALPALFPASYFAVAMPGLGVLGVLALLVPSSRGTWRSRAVLPLIACMLLGGLSVFGVAGAGTPWQPRPPIDGSRWFRPSLVPLQHRSDSVTTASVAYDQSQHSLVLFTDEFRAAETGPLTGYMRVQAHLPMLLAGQRRRAAVIALGTGTTANAIVRWPELEAIDAVELSRAVLELTGWFAGDGPVATPRAPPFFEPRVTRILADGRRYLAQRAAGSLDVITLEPLLPYAPGTAPLYTREFYALAAQALAEDGVLLQWVPAAAMPRATFETLLLTFARSLPHVSVWLVERSTLLAGSRRPHLPPPELLRARLERAPDAVRAELHAAGIATADDLLAAFVGDDVLAVCGAAEELRDDRPFVERIGYWSGAERLAFFARNAECLAAIAGRSQDRFGGPTSGAARVRRLQGLAQSGGATARAVHGLAAARALLPRSVLLHAEETEALRYLAEAEALRQWPGGAARIALAHLRRDEGSALLQLLRAAPGPDGRAGLDAARAAAFAAALDPTLFVRLPEALRPLAPLDAPRSPLADLALLPAPAELLAQAATDDPRGLGLRVRFRVRVARAGLEALRTAPLEAAAAAALRLVLDPFVLEQAAERIAARGGSLLRELLPLWRHDLPMPKALAALADGDVETRVQLAFALGGRRGEEERALLARLLLDGDRAVRVSAGAALYETAGDRIRYDADAGAEERARAAAELLR
jgi:spermidine synthase